MVYYNDYVNISNNKINIESTTFIYSGNIGVT